MVFWDDPHVSHNPSKLRLCPPPPPLTLLSVLISCSCSADPQLGLELGSPLSSSLDFFDVVTQQMAPTVLAALGRATGCKAYSMEEARFAYRYAILFSHLCT